MNDCIVFDDAGVSYKLQIGKGTQAISGYGSDKASSRRIKAVDHTDGNQYLVAHFMDRDLTSTEIKNAIQAHSPNPYVK